MAEMLLINPRKRRGTRKAKTTAKRRVVRRRNPAPVVAHRRRRNPIGAAKRRMMHVARRTVRRRRNPIGLGSSSTYVNMIKDAVIGGAGAVAVDLAFGQINGYLPASMQRTPGVVGTGDAVKAVLTVALGQLLNKVTKGYSRKAAAASLTVQAHDIIKTFVPASMALGYASPARIVQGSARIGPMRRGGGSVGRYMAPGASTILGQYTSPGSGALLSGRHSVMQREGVSAYY